MRYNFSSTLHNTNLLTGTGHLHSSFLFVRPVQIDNVGNLAPVSAVARYTNDFIMDIVIYLDNIFSKSMSRSSALVYISA